MANLPWATDAVIETAPGERTLVPSSGATIFTSGPSGAGGGRGPSLPLVHEMEGPHASSVVARPPPWMVHRALQDTSASASVHVSAHRPTAWPSSQVQETFAAGTSPSMSVSLKSRSSWHCPPPGRLTPMGACANAVQLSAENR